MPAKGVRTYGDLGDPDNTPTQYVDRSDSEVQWNVLTIGGRCPVLVGRVQGLRPVPVADGTDPTTVLNPTTSRFQPLECVQASHGAAVRAKSTYGDFTIRIRVPEPAMDPELSAAVFQRAKFTTRHVNRSGTSNANQLVSGALRLCFRVFNTLRDVKICATLGNSYTLGGDLGSNQTSGFGQHFGPGVRREWVFELAESPNFEIYIGAGKSDRSPDGEILRTCASGRPLPTIVGA
ncbi:hypothetical protein B0H16DRAFT_1459808 [Mycena metata]|uniref:Uncharacterized protein n=1 Tax=Mycena metata TaxID=1033252 RepID=A0AAD7N9P2_9AGAR|nr:hypothetical protein B0H16DRAFT_1459808 [Mycena metata]